METLTPKEISFYVAAGLIIALCVYPATKPLFGAKPGLRLIGTVAVVGLCLIGIDRTWIQFVENHYAALGVALLTSVAAFIWAFWKARLRKRQRNRSHPPGPQ